VHVHKNGNLQERRSEEQDLLAAHPEAYSPVGCNVKPGG
jgi:hypothetical protein